MRIKSFIASTVQEALKNVKREMGSTSIILETRNIEAGDIKSMDGQTLVEVVAAENNSGKNSDGDEGLEDGQDVQDDRDNPDLQLPDQDPSDTPALDSQQSGQNASATEYKDLHDDRMNKVNLADYLHSDDLEKRNDLLQVDHLSVLSGPVEAGETGQVPKRTVGSKVEIPISHVRNETKNSDSNTNLLSLRRHKSGSVSSSRQQSKRCLTDTKRKGHADNRRDNVTLADHFLTEDLIEMAGHRVAETKLTPAHHQSCDSDDGDWPEQSRGLFKQLSTQQVEEKHSKVLIKEVLRRLSKDEYDRIDLHYQILRECIIHKIRISDSYVNNLDECKTMVFLGSAGTGKTTAILKLASETKKRSDKEILLISIRGNSAEKLRKTADRIGATLRTVTSRLELRKIRDEHEGSSHIFIDTPGISCLDDNSLSNLKGAFDEIPNMEAHLVVSATTRYADIINIINKFTQFNIDRLLFTRIDETSLYGTLLSVAMETQIPLSCISDGQEVPEDIRPVTKEMVADMVLCA